MKDWKLEYEKIKVQLEETRKQLQYERGIRERRESDQEDLRNKFKELLIEVLGR